MIPALTFALYTVALDGETVLPKVRAAVAGGRVLLPVRALGAALGAAVRYDARTRSVVVRRAGRSATVGAADGIRLADGRAYAPLRSVASVFGLHVSYRANTRTVALDEPSDRAAPVAPPAAPATYTVLLQPPQGAVLHDAYPTISARFAGVADIDPASLRVTFDGADVTGAAAVVGDEVLLVPRSAVAPGPHAVTVDARDRNGDALAQSWSFEDDFIFAAGPPPAPYPISALWIDRPVSPGTRAFDVFVQGNPGMSGIVSLDGVPGAFPLEPAGPDVDVAHVVVPPGVNRPYARLAARIVLPNGRTTTVVLPQTLQIVTLGSTAYPAASPSPAPPSPAASPRPFVHRSLAVPSPSPGRRRTPLAPAHAPPSAAPATPRPLATP